MKEAIMQNRFEEHVMNGCDVMFTRFTKNNIEATIFIPKTSMYYYNSMKATRHNSKEINDEVSAFSPVVVKRYASNPNAFKVSTFPIAKELKELGVKDYFEFLFNELKEVTNLLATPNND